jgi:hypothetical protein
MRQMNANAVEMIPVRLIISIAIISAIAVMMIFASSSLRILLAEHQVEQECQLLESTLSTMVGSGVPRDVDEASAAQGTKRVQTFTLPDSLLYLSFGGDPDSLNTGMLKPGLIEGGSAIFYRVDGGSKQVIWLPKEIYKFREGTYVDNKWVINGTGQSYIVQSGGKITLVFERVQKNHVIYILIYGTDESSK